MRESEGKRVDVISETFSIERWARLPLSYFPCRLVFRFFSLIVSQSPGWFSKSKIGHFLGQVLQRVGKVFQEHTNKLAGKCTLFPHSHSWVWSGSSLCHRIPESLKMMRAIFKRCTKHCADRIVGTSGFLQIHEGHCWKSNVWRTLERSMMSSTSQKVKYRGKVLLIVIQLKKLNFHIFYMYYFKLLQAFCGPILMIKFYPVTMKYPNIMCLRCRQDRSEVKTVKCLKDVKFRVTSPCSLSWNHNI